MFTLAILVGVFIALGAVFATTAAAGTAGAVPYGVQRLIVGTGLRQRPSRIRFRQRGTHSVEDRTEQTAFRISAGRVPGEPLQSAGVSGRLVDVQRTVHDRSHPGNCPTDRMLRCGRLRAQYCQHVLCAGGVACSMRCVERVLVDGQQFARRLRRHYLVRVSLEESVAGHHWKCHRWRRAGRSRLLVRLPAFESFCHPAVIVTPAVLAKLSSVGIVSQRAAFPIRRFELSCWPFSL